MNITNLITNKMKPGSTLKASSWRAEQVSKTRREIWHYATLMATLEGKTFTQVSRGWGSVSDGKGLSKLRAGVRSKNYKEAQGEFSK
jgi:hypothetical protein